MCLCLCLCVSVLCALCVGDLFAWWIIVMYLYMCVVFVCACVHACMLCVYINSSSNGQFYRLCACTIFICIEVRLYVSYNDF